MLVCFRLLFFVFGSGGEGVVLFCVAVDVGASVVSGVVIRRENADVVVDVYCWGVPPTFPLGTVVFPY